MSEGLPMTSAEIRGDVMDDDEAAKMYDDEGAAEVVADVEGEQEPLPTTSAEVRGDIMPDDEAAAEYDEPGAPGSTV